MKRETNSRVAHHAKPIVQQNYCQGTPEVMHPLRHNAVCNEYLFQMTVSANNRALAKNDCVLQPTKFVEMHKKCMDATTKSRFADRGENSMS